MKVLTTKIGYVCPIFKVEERFVKYKNDYSEIHYVIVRQPGTNIIALNNEGKIVLIKQLRGKENIEKVDLVGGKIDHFEVVLEQAQQQAEKELSEETGYKAKNVELLQIFDISVNWLERKYFQFIAWDLEQLGATPENGENIKLLEVMPDEVVQMINSNMFVQHEEDALVKALQIFKQKKLI